MPTTIPAPRGLRVPVAPLTAKAFAGFGEVVESPLRGQKNGATPPALPSNAVYANQGTAVKVLDVSHATDFYAEAPSGRPSKVVMNMFVCSPRALRREVSATVGGAETAGRVAVGFEDVVGVGAGRRPGEEKEELFFDVRILERHPYTSQTFIPMGLAAEDPSTCYLVVVAPTLPSDAQQDRREEHLQRSWRRAGGDFFAGARASLGGAGPVTAAAAPTGRRKGPGLPDLRNVRAFLANGRQAVTYGAGTWHAPMVVLGLREVEFVVVQFANGVAVEDCQEVELETEGVEGEGVAVVIEVGRAGDGRGREEFLRAKL